MNKNHIQFLIKNGRILEAIDIMLEQVPSQAEIKNEILSLSARYNFFESKLRTGIIDDETISKNHSIIVSDLLKIVDRVEIIDYENSQQLVSASAKSPDRKLVEISSGYPNLSPILKNAVKLSVWGAVISTTISKYTSDMIEILQRNGQIRLLISTPTKEVFEFQKFRSSMITDKKYMLNITMNSINSALLIKDQVENGNIEIRSIPSLPSFGIIEIESQLNKKVIFTRMSGFKNSSGKQPVLKIEDGTWQEYFSEQFEGLWGKGSVICKENIDQLHAEWRKLLDN